MGFFRCGDDDKPSPQRRHKHPSLPDTEELDPTTEYRRPPPRKRQQQRQRQPLAKRAPRPQLRWPRGDAWIPADPAFIAMCRAIR